MQQDADGAYRAAHSPQDGVHRNGFTRRAAQLVALSRQLPRWIGSSDPRASQPPPLLLVRPSALSMTGAKVFNRESAYVAASRAKDNTEIVTSDPATMLKNAGKDVSKSTALDAPELGQFLESRQARLREQKTDQRVIHQQSIGRTLSI